MDLQVGGANKEPLRTTIRRYIQKLINEGYYKPGDRIVETRLAKELNVSQAPVREAMLELSVMGLLEERPYSGTFVKVLSPADIEDIYNTRAFIEEYAAGRAAKYASDGQIEQLRQTLDDMRMCSDPDYFVKLDMNFHEIVMDAACSNALKQVWTMLRMSEWTYSSTHVTSRSLHDLAESHAVIYECIRLRSSHSASANMFLHIKSFAADMVKNLCGEKDEK